MPVILFDRKAPLRVSRQGLELLNEMQCRHSARRRQKSVAHAEVADYPFQNLGNGVSPDYWLFTTGIAMSIENADCGMGGYEPYGCSSNRFNHSRRDALAQY